MLDEEKYGIESLKRLGADDRVFYCDRPASEYSKEFLILLLNYVVRDARAKLEGTGKRLNHGGELLTGDREARPPIDPSTQPIG